jgi:hypothetical protein
VLGCGSGDVGKFMSMAWTKVILFDGSITYWICGIYKITRYDSDAVYHAYYIKDGEKNWGWHVCTPPAVVDGYKVWASLEGAKSDCEAHAASYVPKASTVRRAAEVLASFALEAA